MTSSVSELITLFGAERKQKFWDYFDGTSLKSWWREHDIASGGIFAMVDASDEGFSITTPTSGSARNEIDFNNIRQFSQTASAFIAEIRRVTDGTADAQANVGLMNTSLNQNDFYRFSETKGNSFVRMVARRSSSTNTDMTTVISTNWLLCYAKISSTFLKGYTNGDFGGIVTVNLSNTRLQPGFMSTNQTTSVAAESRIRYYEAWNM